MDATTAAATDMLMRQRLVKITSLLPWAVFLLQQTKQVIDVYALACQYASAQYGTVVRTDDVRSIMTTAFINLSKQGGANVT